MDDSYQISFGERLHEPSHCDLQGRPHYGPCIDPAHQHYLIVETIREFFPFGVERISSTDISNDLAKRIVDRLSNHRIGSDYELSFEEIPSDEEI